ncbi:DgyrCDS3723 [Dimorphilus gyrociliatus]|uniref:DgyrCDS3723 n=1 Tax=Dimorphilus gyrociliatus TaxID=2664684 RepID=A0A7I8VES1_9ANNE|nr:DgyrCDS3723 [Dimorphilus gyrociliatus]
MKKLVHIQDTMYLNCTVQSTNGPLPFSNDNYLQSFKALRNRCESREKISLCRFFSSLVAIQLSNGYEVKSDLIAPSIKFNATPIQNVPLVNSALAKNLASPYCRSYVLGEAQTGYLSMDQTRKVLLILESDPKVSKLPIVGIWISGVSNISDPFVWSCCTRYVYGKFDNRVHPPTEPFLLMLYTTEHSNRQMYDIIPIDRNISLGFNLFTFNDNLQNNRRDEFNTDVHSFQYNVENAVAKRALFNSCLKNYEDVMKIEKEDDFNQSNRSKINETLFPQPTVERDRYKPVQMKSDIPDLTLLDELSPEPIQTKKTININESIPNQQQLPNTQEKLTTFPSSNQVDNYPSNQVQQPQQQVPAEWLDILKRQNEEIKSLRSQVERLLNEQRKVETNRDVSIQNCMEAKKVETCSIGINTSITEKSINTPAGNRFEETINSPFDANRYNTTFGDIRIENTSYETNRSERIIDMPEFNSMTSDKLSQSNHSPVLGESVSMYQQGGFQAIMPTFEETKNDRASKLFDEDYSSFSESDEEKMDNFRMKDNCTERSCSPVKLQPTTPKKVSISNVTIDIAAKTRKELEHLGVCFDPDNENFSFKPAADGTLYLDVNFLPKVQYTSLFLPSSEYEDTDSLALKYLNDTDLTSLSKGENKCTEPTIFQSNNMSFATRKYMERYGLVDEKDEKAPNKKESLHKQSKTPAKQLQNSINEKKYDSRFLDIEKLKALPSLI